MEKVGRHKQPITQQVWICSHYLRMIYFRGAKNIERNWIVFIHDYSTGRRKASKLLYHKISNNPTQKIETEEKPKIKSIR
jgi:hypothetical protein